MQNNIFTGQVNIEWEKSGCDYVIKTNSINNQDKVFYICFSLSDLKLRVYNEVGELKYEYDLNIFPISEITAFESNYTVNDILLGKPINSFVDLETGDIYAVNILCLESIIDLNNKNINHIGSHNGIDLYKLENCEKCKASKLSIVGEYPDNKKELFIAGLIEGGILGQISDKKYISTPTYLVLDLFGEIDKYKDIVNLVNVASGNYYGYIPRALWDTILWFAPFAKNNLRVSIAKNYIIVKNGRLWFPYLTRESVEGKFLKEYEAEKVFYTDTVVSFDISGNTIRFYIGTLNKPIAIKIRLIPLDSIVPNNSELLRNRMREFPDSFFYAYTIRYKDTTYYYDIALFSYLTEFISSFMDRDFVNTIQNSNILRLHRLNEQVSYRTPSTFGGLFSVKNSPFKAGTIVPAITKRAVRIDENGNAKLEWGVILDVIGFCTPVKNSIYPYAYGTTGVFPNIIDFWNKDYLHNGYPVDYLKELVFPITSSILAKHIASAYRANGEPVYSAGWSFEGVEAVSSTLSGVNERAVYTISGELSNSIENDSYGNLDLDILLLLYQIAFEFLISYKHLDEYRGGKGINDLPRELAFNSMWGYTRQVLESYEMTYFVRNFNVAIAVPVNIEYDGDLSVVSVVSDEVNIWDIRSGNISPEIKKFIQQPYKDYLQWVSSILPKSG